MSDIIRYARGDVRPVRQERGIASAAQVIYDETRLAGMKADASVALAGHIMEGLTKLDGYRKALAGEDPVLDMLLTDIEATAINQVKKVQRQLFDPWAL